jgi:hypothetical protein
MQAKQAQSKERQFTKINLSNEKGKKAAAAVNRYQTNIVYSKSKERQQSGSKSKPQPKKNEFPQSA